jgi:MFS family permease
MDAPRPEPEVTQRGWAASETYLLIVLTLVGTVNWADRQVVPILFPGIREELGLTDTQLGIIGGLAFSIIYALSSFAFGYAADRRLRKNVMAFGLVVWSLATAASGLADSFWSLFWARFFTGIGEASLYPCALSLIAERFPAARRGRAIGIFAAAAAIGGGLGVGLGGKLAQSVGWHNVFFIYGGAGLLCLPALLLLREEKREQSLAHRESTLHALGSVISDSRLRWLWAAGTIAMASGQGFAAWVPSYFVRSLGLDLTQAGALFGGAALVGGIVGGILGGTLADRRRRARAGGEFDVAGVAALLASVLVLITLSSGAGVAAGIGGLFSTLAIYSIFPGLLSAMLSLAPPHRHGATGAINTLCLGGIGAASGPFLVGAASDGLGSLRLALYLPIAGLLIAGLLALWTGRVVRKTVTAPEPSTQPGTA